MRDLADVYRKGAEQGAAAAEAIDGLEATACADRPRLAESARRRAPAAVILPHQLHFIPAYCPHLDAIERLWALMHRHVTHNKCYASFAEFRAAVLDFLLEQVPRNWHRLCDEVTDNFRVIDPANFRVLGETGYTSPDGREPADALVAAGSTYHVGSERRPRARFRDS